MKTLLLITLMIASLLTFKYYQNQNLNNTLLTEAGNDIFGTIQEVINKLNTNPNTNWKQVNIEALRQHLLDMSDIASAVDVISQTPIKNGLRVVISPNKPRALRSLERILRNYPEQLQSKTGWIMRIKKQGLQYQLTITGKPSDADKIRALGYFGLMTYGNQHQVHHWSIINSKNNHQH